MTNAHYSIITENDTLPLAIVAPQTNVYGLCASQDEPILNVIALRSAGFDFRNLLHWYCSILHTIVRTKNTEGSESVVTPTVLSSTVAQTLIGKRGTVSVKPDNKTVVIPLLPFIHARFESEQVK